MGLRAKIKAGDAVIPFSRWELLNETVAMMVPDSMIGVPPRTLRNEGAIQQMGANPVFALANQQLGDVLFYNHFTQDQIPLSLESVMVRTILRDVGGEKGRTMFPSVHFAKDCKTPAGMRKVELLYYDLRTPYHFQIVATCKLHFRHMIQVIFRVFHITPQTDLAVWKSMCIYMIRSLEPGLRFEEVLEL